MTASSRALVLLTLLTGLAVAQTPVQHREVALTIDDLPAMSATNLTSAAITTINTKIVATLKADKIPAIGFVNEERLYKTGETDARIATLNAWLDAGLDLGNHTFSHTSLNHVELKDWEDDVIFGETVTRMLSEAHKKDLHYLRHPYLDVGPDLNTRRAAEEFLIGRGYRIAPVTIDPRDWYFADLYDDAHTRHDVALMPKLAEAWLTYTDQVLTHDEQISRTLLGYEPKQILLLHATWLEADHLPDLIALLRKHGYTFLSLADALADPAYAQPDTYISDVGASWIQHWAVTRGHAESTNGKPTIPKWVEDLHAAFDRSHPDD